MSALVRSDRGFSLIEVLVAILLLTVGVIGTMTLLTAASASTARTRSLEAGTNLVRQVVEDSHAPPYSQLTQAGLLPALQAQDAQLADADPATPGWQVIRRGITFTLSASVCAVDDPQDQTGPHAAGADPPFCVTANQGAGSQDPQPADYDRVTVTASWRDHTRARSVQQQTVILPGTGSGSATGSPSDAAAGAPVVTSPTLVNGQIAPCASPNTSCSSQYTFNSTTLTSVNFSVPVTGAASNVATATVKWYVDGALNGTAVGTGATRTFTWNATTGLLSTYPSQTPDGSYTISAQAFDSSGLALGSAATVRVILNRFLPDVTGYTNNAGRNDLFPVSPPTNPASGIPEIEWFSKGTGRVDRDYSYLQVAKVTNQGQTITYPATCDRLPVTGSSCIDSADPGRTSNVLQYAVYPHDKWPDGTDRGAAYDASALNALSRDVNGANRRPTAPTALTLTRSGRQVTLSWTLPPAPGDPDSGDYIDSFRVYQDVIDTAHRVGRTPFGGNAYPCAGATGCPSSSIVITDDGQPHKYWITAVDTRLDGSVPLGPVTG